MPRYLVLTELFLPTKGGTAVWFAEVYRRLSGKETHIVTADVPGAVEVDAGHPNTVHRINMRRVPWLRPESLGMYVNLFTKSLWLALTHRFDAIHAGRALPEGFTAWLVARLTFHPVVIYAHGEELTTWGNGGKYKAMRFALRHADFVIANSEFTRDELLKMDVTPARITLIYPGVDVARFRPGLTCDDLRLSVGVGRGGKLILSVGRLSRRKGFDQVIKSLPALVQAGLDVQYTLIGIGEDQEYLLDLAREHGVAEHVHLIGHVSADDLPRWYNACDVFAMPNREINGDTEGFGMVFIEAAACAKPAIAGLAGGTGAAVLDGVTGLRVDGTRVGAVENALSRILLGNDRSIDMGRQGLARIAAEFSWEVVAQKTIAIS
ncbi:MAG: glycosyltransferase family 4 protein [Sulfuriferula sp.]